MNNKQRCGSIFMTLERFLIFQCDKCPVKSNNFGDILHHFEEHWPDYNVKTAIKIANKPNFDTEIKSDNAKGDELQQLQEEQLFGETDPDADDEPYEMIEYHLEDYDQQMNDEDEAENFINGILEEAIKTEDIKNDDPLTEENTTKKQMSPKFKKISTIKPKLVISENRKNSEPLTTEEKTTNYIQKATGIFVYKCDKCDSIFPTSHRLKIHERSHSSDRNFICKFCGFAFKESFNLRVHLRRHTGKKRFKCEHCTKMFITRSEMLTHERRHTGERPFICSECGLGFVSSGALHIHSKRHNNEREHKCEICGKEFYDSYQLKDHKAVHTSERNHVCGLCNASFTRLKSLKAHNKLHENKREYVCDICQAAFNQKPSLTMHLRNTHRVLKSGTILRENEQNKSESKKVNSPKMSNKSGPPICEHCLITFPNMMMLIQHIEQVHNGEAIAIDEVNTLQEEYIEHIKEEVVEVTAQLIN